MLDDLITAAEARETMGLQERQLYLWVAQGRLKAYKTRFTAYTLYSRSEIEKVATPAYGMQQASFLDLGELERELAS